MKRKYEFMSNGEFNKMLNEEGYKNAKVNTDTTLENYYVNENGKFIKKIRSTNTTTTFLRLTTNAKTRKDGYLVVALDKVRTLHRVVAFTFIENDDTKNKVEVDHIDRNHDNNNATNLRWVTKKENNKFERADKHENYGRYNTKTNTLVLKDGTKIEMSPLDYISWRRNNGLETSKIYANFIKKGLI